MNYDIQNDRPKIFLEHRRDEDLLPTFGVKHLGGIYIPLLTPADIARIRKFRIRGHFHLGSSTVSKMNSFVMLLFIS